MGNYCLKSTLKTTAIKCRIHTDPFAVHMHDDWIFTLW